LSDSPALAAVFGFLGFMAMSIVSALPRIREPFPFTISSRAVEITNFGQSNEWLWPNILTAIATTVLFLFLSIKILKRKEL
jgi:hypothetical protein